MKLIKFMRENIQRDRKKTTYLQTRLIVVIITLVIVFVVGYLFHKNKTDRTHQVPSVARTVKPTLLPSVIPSSPLLYPYYYTDKQGVWKKDAKDNVPIRIFDKKQDRLLSDSEGIYKFILEDKDVILTAFIEKNSTDANLYECRYINQLKTDCIFIDKADAYSTVLVAKIPDKTAYVYVKTNSGSDLPAQSPWSLYQLILRDYQTGKTELIGQAESMICADMPSWNYLYRSGYHREITVTTNGIVIIDLDCGLKDNFMVFDINKKERLLGSWDFINPVEVKGNRILFHRIPDKTGQIDKSLTHVFFYASLSDLRNEDRIFQMEYGKYITGTVYDQMSNTLYISYIHDLDEYEGPLSQKKSATDNNFELKIASINLDDNVLQPQDLFSTKGNYIDSINKIEDNIIYKLHYFDENSLLLQDRVELHLLNLGTLTDTIQSDIEIYPGLQGL